MTTLNYGLIPPSHLPWQGIEWHEWHWSEARQIHLLAITQQRTQAVWRWEVTWRAANHDWYKAPER